MHSHCPHCGKSLSHSLKHNNPKRNNSEISIPLRRNHHVPIGEEFITLAGRRGRVLSQGKDGKSYNVRWSDGTFGSVNDDPKEVFRVRENPKSRLSWEEESLEKDRIRVQANLAIEAQEKSLQEEGQHRGSSTFADALILSRGAIISCWKEIRSDCLYGDLSKIEKKIKKVKALEQKAEEEREAWLTFRAEMRSRREAQKDWLRKYGGQND